MCGMGLADWGQIGYYHLADPCPEALDGTEFEPYREVFSGAWSRIQRAIDIAGKRGIGILIGEPNLPGSP